MPGKNSILGEIEVNLSTIKRIVSSFQHLILCVFLIFGSFLPFVKSIKALSKKRDKTVAILRLLSYF